MLIDYVMLWPFVILSLMIIVYLAVRFALDWRDQYQARRMRTYSQPYGGANYIATHRPNVRGLR